MFKKYYEKNYEKNYEPATYPQHWDIMLFLRQFWIIIKNLVSFSILIVPNSVADPDPGSGIGCF